MSAKKQRLRARLRREQMAVYSAQTEAQKCRKAVDLMKGEVVEVMRDFASRTTRVYRSPDQAQEVVAMVRISLLELKRAKRHAFVDLSHGYAVHLLRTLMEYA